MAQMQPQWSLRNIERTEDVLAEEVSSMIAGLFNWRSARFRWFDAKRWKFSLPTGRADVEKLEAFETDRIFVAGDSILGKGRVTLALQSGLDVAARIYDSD